MKFTLPLLILMTLSHALAGVDQVSDCLKARYTKLTDRNAIAAAVVGEDKTEILLFGQATHNKLFEIGSITKTFTGTLLAHTILSGKIKLNDPIPAFYQRFDEPITYGHLTTHTAGYTDSINTYYEASDPMNPYEGLTKTLFRELYPKLQLLSRPGEKYLYSNTGVGILGQSLEEINGDTYENLIQKNILNVLGMNDTYFEVPSAEYFRFQPGNVNGYTWPYWNLFKTALSAAGSLRSTIKDMAIYLKANLFPQSSSLNSAIELAQTPIFKRDHQWMAMNWITIPSQEIVAHNGSTIAFNSSLIFSKKLKMGVVVMTDTAIYVTNENDEEVYDDQVEDAATECLLSL